MSAKDSKKSKLVKTIMIYFFLVFVSFMVADLVLLKFVRPKFIPEITAKDLTGLNIAREDYTGALSPSQIGSKNALVGPTLKRNIFNMGKMPPPLASLNSEEPSDEFEDNVPVKTSLSLTLEGTAVHRNPFKSISTIQGSKETLTYTVGDQIENVAELVSILRKKVIFRNLQNKRLEYVEIDRNTVRAKAPKKRVSISKPVSSGAISREGNRFKTTRGEVDKYLKDYRSLLTQANTKPVKDPATGDILGFEVFAIKSGGIFDQLGLENGDIIDSVNGQSVTDQGKAMSLFNELRSANEIKISINRGGRTEELQYQID